MSSNDMNPQDKPNASFTIKQNMLYLYILFPLLFTVMIIGPLAFYAFINLFIGVHVRNNILNLVVLNSVAAIIAFLSGFCLSLNVRKVATETAKYNRLVSLIPLALNAIAVLIAYSSVGIDGAKIAVFVVNPLFFVVNLLFESILTNSVVLIMFLTNLSFAVAFFIFTRKAFIVQQKKQIRIFALVTAAVMTFAFASCTFAVYPEVEYEILKRKYESLPFAEEVNYKFYENLPFREDNQLVKMEKPLTLDFSDIMTTPRLDGATAFYPVYAAIVQNCYSGLQAELEKRDLRFYGDPWGQNIYLYLSYEQQNPLLNRCAELIQCTQTTNAYNGLADGKSDMVFAFEPSDAQIAYAKEKGVEFELTPIGYDAFCFFVNQQNPVDNLRLGQVQDIYSGKTNNWKEVGGNNKRIFAFTRPKNSGSQTIMENLVMKDIAINTRYEPKMVVQSMGGMIYIVDGYLNTPAAIGYTFMYYSSFMVTGESIKYLSIDGVAPTNDTVRSGAYRFSTPFYAVTVKGQQSAETQELLDWLQGAQGQQLIEACGYVGL